MNYVIVCQADCGVMNRAVVQIQKKNKLRLFHSACLKVLAIHFV